MLEKEITDTLKEALKSGDKVKVSVLRMLISDMKNKKIEDRSKEIDDQKVLGLIQKMVKRHKESIEQFKTANRDDLVSKENEEMAVLEKYLPEQLSKEELTEIIIKSIEMTGASSPQDLGKVMGSVLAQVKGRADGKIVSMIVKEKLS